MKIEACASTRQRDDHTVADDKPVAMRFDAQGNVVFTLHSQAITLSRDHEYHLYVTVEPSELDALYRFSMTGPKP